MLVPGACNVSGWAIAGLVIMVASEAATLARIEPFWSWNTPIAWTGFILFADSIVWRRRGNSWIRSARGEFAWLAVVSIPLWLVFEIFNGFIDNWYYVGLPENRLVRDLGYAWAFATIWPAIFEAAELVAVVRDRHRRPGEHCEPRARGSVSSRNAADPGLRAGNEGSNGDSRRPSLTPAGRLSIACGAAMLVWPALAPAWLARYLAAPVWLGFIFLLDPINARLGAPSLGADIRTRRYDRLIHLTLGGLLCGVLWEFWNYWSRSKWHYAVPIMANVRVFEMPLPGYLGFPAFALECFTMYVFVRAVATRVSRPGAAGAAGVPPRGLQTAGRTIAL
jgi:hypothetical protein